MLNDSLDCGPIEHKVDYDSTRFALILYVGTPLALVGIVNNALLFALFIRPKYRNSPMLYLGFLALLDIAICLIYPPLFTVDAVALYLHVEWLYRIWHLYVMLLFCLSRIAQLASSYLVLCATLERFVLVVELSLFRSLTTSLCRWIAIVCVLLLSSTLRLPSYWEYDIQYKSGCQRFDDFEFVPILAGRHDYGVYNFYIAQIIQVLIPFVLLLVLNLLIIFFVRSKMRHQTSVTLAETCTRPFDSLERSHSLSRKRLKYANWTMVTIVFTYLICNAVNVFVTIMERFGGQHNPLLFNSDGSSTMFYTYSADMISIMVLLNSFIRLIIYSGCNPEIRTDFHIMLCERRNRHRNSSCVDKD